jgi:hypothetical protein
VVMSGDYYLLLLGLVLLLDPLRLGGIVVMLFIVGVDVLLGRGSGSLALAGLLLSCGRLLARGASLLGGLGAGVLGASVSTVAGTGGTALLLAQLLQVLSVKTNNVSQTRVDMSKVT